MRCFDDLKFLCIMHGETCKNEIFAVLFFDED